MGTKAHFERFAAYNRWANARLYEAAFALPEDDYRRDVGAFFGSLHGTLNHLLVADRIWMKRLDGDGEQPARLDTILFEDRADLAIARLAEDDRISRYVGSLDDALLDGMHAYVTTTGRPFEQIRAHILAHLFNHQTHHRGQAHTILSVLTGAEPPPLDLLAMDRSLRAPDLGALASCSR